MTTVVEFKDVHAAVAKSKHHTRTAHTARRKKEGTLSRKWWMLRGYVSDTTAEYHRGVALGVFIGLFTLLYQVNSIGFQRFALWLTTDADSNQDVFKQQMFCAFITVMVFLPLGLMLGNALDQELRFDERDYSNYVDESSKLFSEQNPENDEAIFNPVAPEECQSALNWHSRQASRLLSVYDSAEAVGRLLLDVSQHHPYAPLYRQIEEEGAAVAAAAAPAEERHRYVMIERAETAQHVRRRASSVSSIESTASSRSERRRRRADIKSTIQAKGRRLPSSSSIKALEDRLADHEDGGLSIESKHFSADEMQAALGASIGAPRLAIPTPFAIKATALRRDRDDEGGPADEVESWEITDRYHIPLMTGRPDIRLEPGDDTLTVRGLDTLNLLDYQRAVSSTPGEGDKRGKQASDRRVYRAVASDKDDVDYQGNLAIKLAEEVHKHVRQSARGKEPQKQSIEWLSEILRVFAKLGVLRTEWDRGFAEQKHELCLLLTSLLSRDHVRGMAHDATGYLAHDDINSAAFMSLSARKQSWLLCLLMSGHDAGKLTALSILHHHKTFAADNFFELMQVYKKLFLPKFWNQKTKKSRGNSLEERLVMLSDMRWFHINQSGQLARVMRALPKKMNQYLSDLMDLVDVADFNSKEFGEDAAERALKAAPYKTAREDLFAAIGDNFWLAGAPAQRIILHERNKSLSQLFFKLNPDAGEGECVVFAVAYERVLDQLAIDNGAGVFGDKLVTLERLLAGNSGGAGHALFLSEDARNVVRRKIVASLAEGILTKSSASESDRWQLLFQLYEKFYAGQDYFTFMIETAGQDNFALSDELREQFHREAIGAANFCRSSSDAMQRFNAGEGGTSAIARLYRQGGSSVHQETVSALAAAAGDLYRVDAGGGRSQRVYPLVEDFIAQWRQAHAITSADFTDGDLAGLSNIVRNEAFSQLRVDASQLRVLASSAAPQANRDRINAALDELRRVLTHAQNSGLNAADAAERVSVDVGANESVQAVANDVVMVKTFFADILPGALQRTRDAVDALWAAIDARDAGRINETTPPALQELAALNRCVKLNLLDTSNNNILQACQRIVESNAMINPDDAGDAHDNLIASLAGFVKGLYQAKRYRDIHIVLNRLSGFVVTPEENYPSARTLLRLLPLMGLTAEQQDDLLVHLLRLIENHFAGGFCAPQSYAYCYIDHFVNQDKKAYRIEAYRLVKLLAQQNDDLFSPTGVFAGIMAFLEKPDVPMPTRQKLSSALLDELHREIKANSTNTHALLFAFLQILSKLDQHLEGANKAEEPQWRMNFLGYVIKQFKSNAHGPHQADIETEIWRQFAWLIEHVDQFNRGGINIFSGLVDVLIAHKYYFTSGPLTTLLAPANGNTRRNLAAFYCHYTQQYHQRCLQSFRRRLFARVYDFSGGMRAVLSHHIAGAGEDSVDAQTAVRGALAPGEDNNMAAVLENLCLMFDREALVDLAYPATNAGVARATGARELRNMS